jgi:WD40-like Beta Propeller Repeat
MRRDPLDEALREAPIPVPAEAEQRGLELVEAAYAQRQPRRRRAPLPRLALAFSVTTLLAALLLSPAGAAVREWVDDVVTTSAPRPEPQLAEIPGGGRLLVQSAVGPWVVQPDGARRLLGDYDEASWSPRGLYAAVVKGRTLSAVEVDGTPRWSIPAAARLGDPRWSPSGERIVYRVGKTLRIVAGDGTGDRLLTRSTAPVAPAWSPLGDAGLAYVSSAGMLRIVHGENGDDLAIGPAGSNVNEIEWGGGGATILATSPRGVSLQAVQPSKVDARPRVGSRRELPLPRGSTVVDSALAPERPAVAVVLTRSSDSGIRSSILIFGAGAEKPWRLLDVPGSIDQVAWSPDGRRILIALSVSDQWLFFPVGRGVGHAINNISAAFAPGRQVPSFPRIEGWCCRG